MTGLWLPGDVVTSNELKLPGHDMPQRYRDMQRTDYQCWVNIALARDYWTAMDRALIDSVAPPMTWEHAEELWDRAVADKGDGWQAGWPTASPSPQWRAARAVRHQGGAGTRRPVP